MTSERILVVEDDEAASRVMKLALGRDYQVTQASTRSDALADAETLAPDLVLMDYLMPGPSAEDFIASLLELGFTGPIVLCTGMTKPLGLDVDAVVIKPYDPEELVRTVAATLNSRP